MSFPGAVSLTESGYAPRWSGAAANTLARARRWSGPLAWSVADQGVTGGTHFALNLLLARWLEPAGYGAFALGYALFLLGSGVHSAVILEPMAVLGPARYAGDQRRYRKAVVRLHFVLTAGIAGVLLAGAGVLARMGHPAAASVAAAGLAGPWILLFWLYRRFCYLEARPERAAGGSLLYALALSGLVLWLWKHGAVSPPAALAAMGCAGVAASLFLARPAAPAVEPGGAPPDAQSEDVVAGHWGYARWSLATTALYWMASSVYVPLVGATGGLGAVAILRAAENLTLPMSHALTAAGLLLLPRLSQKAARAGHRSLRATAVALAAAAAVAAAAYGLVVVLGGGKLIQVVYGQAGQYAASVALLPLLAASLIARAVGDTGFGLAARAAGRPDVAFWATAASALLSCSAGVYLVARHGATGAAAGSALSAVAGCVVAAGLFWRQVR